MKTIATAMADAPVYSVDCLGSTQALSRTVQSVTQAIADTRRSAVDVETASRNLGAEARKIREAVQHFIAAVRAA
jgi:hypothetical protein